MKVVQISKQDWQRIEELLQALDDVPFIVDSRTSTKDPHYENKREGLYGQLFEVLRGIKKKLDQKLTRLRVVSPAKLFDPLDPVRSSLIKTLAQHRRTGMKAAKELLDQLQQGYEAPQDEIEELQTILNLSGIEIEFLIEGQNG